MALAFTPLAILPNYGKCTCIPTFELSNAVQLFVPREKKAVAVSGIPYCPEIPSVILYS